MLNQKILILAISALLLHGYISGLFAQDEEVNPKRGRVNLGIELDYELENSKKEEKNTTTTKEKDTENTFSIIPYIGICPTSLLEISPFCGFYLNSQNSDDGTSESKYRQLGIVPGLGLYFHVLTNSFIDLSLGPKFKSYIYFKPLNESKSSGTKNKTKYDEWRRFSLRIMLQLNIDFLLSNRVDLRLTTSLIKFRYYLHRYQYDESPTETTRKVTALDITSFFTPALGFQLRF